MNSFQDLLAKFCARRADIVMVPGATMDQVRDARLDNLEWAVQSIIERLRDQEAIQGGES